MFFVIDQDGGLNRHDREPTYDLVRAEVGPEGINRVRLDPGYGMIAYANDCGLVLPDRYRRNVVGSGLLVAMGAGQQPYGGPLVVTGWNPRDEWFDACALDEVQAAMVRELHDNVRAALAGGDVLSRDCTCGCGSNWAAEMRAFAEAVRWGQAPGITVLSDGDAVAWLYGGEG